MKKVLVAGTALMLAGSVVAQADAEVNISGDARVSYIGKQDYYRSTDGTDGYDDFFESRVGLEFEGKAPVSGVGAKARVYFDGYGFEDDAPWNGQEPRLDLSVDYAFLTAKLGDWAIKAGRVAPDYSKFFSWNIRPTRVVASYKHGNMDIIPFVGVRAEGSSEQDVWDDNDYMEYGLILAFKLQNDWTMKVYGRYDDDQREWDEGAGTMTVTGDPLAGFEVIESYAAKPHKDKSGFLGDVFLNNEGANCDFGFHAELAYKAADVQGKEDDGLGGYVMLSKAVSSQFTPAVLAGMTKNGFVADNDFGFVMVGGDTSTQVLKVGDGVEDDGSLLFGAFVANYKVSDQLTLTGNLLYADFDNSQAGNLDNAIEVSGVAGYTLTEASKLTYKIGYLTPSVNDASGSDEDAYFAHYLRLNVSF